MSARQLLRDPLKYVTRRFCDLPKQNQGSTSQSSTNVNNVAGLSANVIKPVTESVGPGVDPNKTGAYKVPEYFCYNNMSFFEAEIEMAKYRLPAPSALKK